MFTAAEAQAARREARERRHRTRERATITPGEVPAILANATSPGDDLLIKLSLYAGLRLAEMDELIESDITTRSDRHYLTAGGRVAIRTIALPRIVGAAVEAVRPGLQPGDMLVLPQLDFEGAAARRLRAILRAAGTTHTTAHAPRGHLFDLLGTQNDLPPAHRRAYLGVHGSDPGVLPDGWSEPIADRIDELVAPIVG
ncbi:hypothetical protein [Kitasatospora brasiliensis]|uniref:hypothetical protein n=1 Tax=Kitasatospora brasiliensis TaxID=3058040 RepID=UPI0029317D24|nr:hypothetical protein [Kitasatospora sp. K002]